MKKISEFYWFYVLSLVVVPFGLLIRVLYSNSISVEEFGAIYAIINFLGLVYIFVNFGLSKSLMYYVPKYIERKKFDNIRNLVYYTFFIQISVALILSLVIFLLTNFLSENYFNSEVSENLLKIFLIYFFFLVLFRNLGDVFLAHKLYLYNRYLKFIQLVLIFILSLIIVLFDLNNKALFFALVWGVASAISFIIYLIFFIRKFPYIFQKFPSFNKNLLKKHLSYSRFTFASSIGSNILNQIDVVIVTLFLSVIEVAYYSNAFSLIQTIAMLFGVFGLVFTSLFSELKEKNDIKNLHKILDILYKNIFYFILPIILIFYLYPHIFINLIFGEKYSYASKILGLYALFLIFKIFMNYNISFMNGLGLAKKLSYIIGIGSIVNIFLNLLLIYYLELIGVVIATSLVWIMITIITFYYIYQEINFKLDIKITSKIIFLGFFYISCVKLFSSILYFESLYVRGIISIGISILLYLIFGYLLKIYTIEELYFFIPDSQVKQKLKRFHKKKFSFLK